MLRQISDENITYNGVTYTVEAVKVWNGTLSLTLDKGIPGSISHALRFNAGARQFHAKDAMESWGIEISEDNFNDDAWTLRWTGTGLRWSDGDAFQLGLVSRDVGGL